MTLHKRTPCRVQNHLSNWNGISRMNSSMSGMDSVVGNRRCEAGFQACLPTVSHGHLKHFCKHADTPNIPQSVWAETISPGKQDCASIKKQSCFISPSQAVTVLGGPACLIPTSSSQTPPSLFFFRVVYMSLFPLHSPTRLFLHWSPFLQSTLQFSYFPHRSSCPPLFLAITPSERQTLHRFDSPFNPQTVGLHRD